MPAATAPTREGYTFNGYWDAISGGARYYNNNMSSAQTWNKTANTTLYARWTANTNTVYKVEHSQQDVTGAGYTLFETDNLTGTTATEASAIAKDYTNFGENTAHANRVSTDTIVRDGSLVLKLYYDRITYTVSFNSNDGSAVIAVPDTGYHFVKWSDDLTDNSKTDSNVTGNITATAEFAITTYTITYNLDAGAN